MLPVLFDTHAIVWLLEQNPNLSSRAFQIYSESLKRSQPLYLSAISVVEMVYLIEKKRIRPDALRQLQQELLQAPSALSVVPVTHEIATRVVAIPRDAVSDPMDRMIAATALHLGIPLVTRDAKLRAAGIETLW